MNSLNNNKFYVIRHAQARNNVEGVLVSDPEVCIDDYGLTNLGTQQASEAAVKIKIMLEGENVKNLIIVSSDFRRTRETAEILHSLLNVERPIRFEKALRERGMGKLEKTYYSEEVLKLWLLDEKDPTQSVSGCETVDSIVKRTTSLVKQLDQEYSNETIFLVSHAGPCMHLYEAFHIRTTASMKNTEIRRISK